MYGYVYVLYNLNTRFVKIGHSVSGGAKRAKTVSYDDIDGSFRLEFEIYCQHPEIIEKSIHKHFKKFKQGRRELFQITTKQAIAGVIEVYQARDLVNDSRPQLPEIIDPPNGINYSAWREWSDFRRIDKRKPISNAAAKKQFILLLRYSENQQQSVIDQSISNDYQGLFELKGNSNENNKRSTTNGQTKREQVRQQGDADLDTLRRSLQQSHNSGGELVEADGGSLRLTLDHDTGPDH